MDTPGLTPTAAQQLATVSTATLTTVLFKRGLRNTFLYPLLPLNPDHARFVGEAFTLRYIPAREDIDVLAVFDDYDHPQRKAVESVPPGQVLVMDCRGDGRAASAGDILITRLMRRGAAAVVTDGSFRDSPSLRTLAFPTYAGSVSATTNLALHHAVDLQVPIACAGVPVYPGDVMVGDGEGVVCIPREIVAAVAEEAYEQTLLEEFVLDRVNRGAPLRGTYPADEHTRAEYQVWRSER